MILRNDIPDNEIHPYRSAAASGCRAREHTPVTFRRWTDADADENGAGAGAGFGGLCQGYTRCGTMNRGARHPACASVPVQPVALAPRCRCRRRIVPVFNPLVPKDLHESAPLLCAEVDPLMLGQAASLAPPTDAMALEPPATAASVGEVGIVEGASTSDIVTTPQPAAAASTAATTTGDAAGEPTAGGAPACPSPSASAEPCPMRVDPCPKPVDGDATCGGQGGGGKCKLVTQEDAEQEQAQAQEHAEQPQVAEEGWRRRGAVGKSIGCLFLIFIGGLRPCPPLQDAVWIYPSFLRR